MAQTEAKLALSSDFLTAFARLPRQIQSKTTEFINKFRNNPKANGINYEKLHLSADKNICSVRIDDTYRGIVARQEETGIYLLLWIDHHDEAYNWAKRKRCEVNPITKTIQVYDVIAKEDIAYQPDSVKKNNIFGSIRNKDLMRLGVPESQIDFVKSLADISDFYKAESALSQDVFENLNWLVEGLPLNEVIEMVEKEREETQTEDTESTFITALQRPETLKNFVVIEGEDELKRIMAEPLEKWRVFLHPTQRKIVNKNYSGPARVLGGAGTGKTVVAMHRAKYLASKLEENERILFTTFTANLAADIKENLRKICFIEEMRKIDVINLDAWVARFMKEEGFDFRIAYEGDEINSLWEYAISATGSELDFSQQFYEDEWNRVVIAQEALSKEKYVSAIRTGRGTRLDRKTKIKIWDVFETYLNRMKDQKIRDVNTAMYECSKLITSAKYKHIIVDEAQDFSTNALKLIRKIAGQDKQNNDIFIVGDSHQRIYKNRAVLSKCNIDIRGRSNILKINYRTTEEIRKYAFALLNGIPFDDLDDSVDLGDKCRSLTHGNKPIIQHFDNGNQELEYIVSEIKKLTENGITSNEICIVARTNQLINNYTSYLTKAGLRVFEIRRNKTDDSSMPGIRVATMHRVKGLEFKYVFVVAVNDDKMPLKSAISKVDETSRQESITAEKCLFYVALTRAQKGAYITSYGAKSEFL